MYCMYLIVAAFIIIFYELECSKIGNPDDRGDPGDPL